MNGPNERHRVRLFVGAHLTAVLCIYALALTIGGGVAVTPFPPLERPHPGPMAYRVAAPEPESHPVRIGPAVPPSDVPAPHDVAPPWRVDEAGVVRLSER